MIKVKEFTETKNERIDLQINKFIESFEKEVYVKDIKYNILLDTYNDVIMSTALLIYEEREK